MALHLRLVPVFPAIREPAVLHEGSCVFPAARGERRERSALLLTLKSGRKDLAGMGQFRSSRYRPGPSGFALKQRAKRSESHAAAEREG